MVMLSKSLLTTLQLIDGTFLGFSIVENFNGLCGFADSAYLFFHQSGSGNGRRLVLSLLTTWVIFLINFFELFVTTVVIVFREQFPMNPP